jgi:hypothetical protein
MGHGWGAYAVRRSDFALFSLPPLEADGSDAFNASFFAGVFDNRWLVLLKTNRKLYAIDLIAHPPNTWSQSSDTSQVVDVIATLSDAELAGWTDGAGNLLIPSAVVRDNSGGFLSFGWPVTSSNPLRRSGVIRYTVPTFV